jgi:hypothetical protein
VGSWKHAIGRLFGAAPDGVPVEPAGPDVTPPAAGPLDPALLALATAVGAADAGSEAAWAELRAHGAAARPYLLAAYPTARTWQGRTALVFHAIRFARRSEAAVALGRLVLGDRSYMVRYRACGVLAYALRRDTLPALEPLLRHDDQRTREDAAAAIASIRARNHHRFVDRDGSGRSEWQVNDDDASPS